MDETKCCNHDCEQGRRCPERFARKNHETALMLFLRHALFVSVFIAVLIWLSWVLA